MRDFFQANELRVTPEKLDSTDGEEGYYLGAIDTNDFYRIGLFYYNINHGTVVNKRVGLRNLVKSYINTRWGEFDAALVVFNSNDYWRLSFICDINGEATEAKRYTYVFGDSTSYYNTPVARFAELKNVGVNFTNIKTAFSVEALSKEFFEKYKEQYSRFCDYIYQNRNNINLFGSEFATWHEKRIRDYVKKMMGRIVFLCFLQRKGWLGGDRNYLQNFFTNSTHKHNFLDEVLEPMFFGLLNTPIDSREAKFCQEGWNLSLIPSWNTIPYLNGGLFDKDELDCPQSTISAELFAGLFKFLSQYNFTIDENDPNDAEVGVDPEMLGKIFENLLEDNKDKGAFYTPKEIVQYMCQESLIAYLINYTNGKSTKVEGIEDKIRNLVYNPAEVIERIADYAEEQLLELDKALSEVKICDPAIGSGAFPMGLLNELVACRENIQIALKRDYSRVELKKQIILNNIYGVDIEKGAIDIARLRFWLSIVVDSDVPEQLPNFDYKFMQGNSLIESFMGVDLSEIINDNQRSKKHQGMLAMSFDETDVTHSIKELLRNYFSVKTIEQKTQLKQQINDKVKEFIAHKTEGNYTIQQRLNSVNISANEDFFLWHTWFNDVFAKGGFDIVIGNPPYIQLQSNEGVLGRLYSSCGYQSFASTGDIYCLFYERGWQMLNKGGHLCYITSNKWMRAGYGEKLRNFFVKETNPNLLIDFAGVKIFDSATVDTNILLFEKGKNKHNTICAVTEDKDCLRNLSLYVQQQHSVCDFSSSDSWVILSPIEQSIKRKIEAVGTPLKDWDIQINYGIKTGYNEAFIIPTETRNQILANCQTEDERQRTAELIRPILRGRDIKRYGYNWADLWLINTHNGVKGKFPRIKIEDYPAVKSHLDQHWDKISKRADKGETPYNLRNCAYLEDFYKPKIVWNRIASIKQFTIVDEGVYIQDSMHFIIGNNLNYLCSILNSKLIQWLLSLIIGEAAGGNAGNADNIWNLYIPKANNNDTISDLEVYSLYKLTQNEIDYIEKREA